jgi:ribulose 1,5-bisphosphate carboxylase large subunit-like protein
VNFNLEKNELINNGNNMEVIANDGGITSEPKGTCPGVTATKTAKEKATLTAQGVNAV